jgi:hypothetical protein
MGCPFLNQSPKLFSHSLLAIFDYTKAALRCQWNALPLLPPFSWLGQGYAWLAAWMPTACRVAFGQKLSLPAGLCHIPYVLCA